MEKNILIYAQNLTKNSLPRRGFTLNGQPIISELRSTAGSALVMEEKVAVVKVQVSCDWWRGCSAHL